MARPSLTKAHRGLLGLVAGGACVISGIGFAGSYNAVKELAAEKGFGAFSYAFPIGVDAGIVVLLALDLVLTWLRIPFPLLRQTAWLLTVATIAFNAAASWGDPLGMGMHAVIPLLFVVVVEASRHAVGRIAAITADRHMDSVRLMRWVLSPVPTFRLWRRMKLWELRSYDEVVRLEQNRLVYRAQLRFRYGRGWRRSAPIQALLPLKLAKYGVPLDPTVFDRLDEEARTAREAKEALEAQAAEATREVQEARALVPAAAVAPAVAPAGPQAGQQVAAPGPVPVQAQGAQVPVQPQAQLHAQPQTQGQPQPQAQHQPQHQPQSEAEPTPAEMLAKLAKARIRAAHEPEGEVQAPPQPQEELNVWTERAVRTTGHSTDAEPSGRVPGQASPWFKPPRPTEPEEPQEQSAPDAAAPGQGGVVGGNGEPPYAGYPEEEFPAEPEFEEASDYPAEPEFTEPAPRPFGPAPRPGSHRLDPELAYQALMSYLDRHDGQQPDAERLADWLTREFGVSGSRSDGSVHPKDVDRIFPELRDRYAASGRD
ncbi:DUF2637 domain-containing protein [Kitasatospora sp. NPDC093806]|uniref:DUF2637 domain-containing protein n=1 Tax=Kitasatospora sp. NPDC093806 TaxID=3155075 RepID=UPI00342F6A2B